MPAKIPFFFRDASVVRFLFILMLSSYCFSAPLLEYDGPRPNWDAHNYIIDHKSVCDLQVKGSIEYRSCRREAQRVFKVRCKEKKALLKRSDKDYIAKYNLDKTSKMYCTAARLYRP